MQGVVFPTRQPRLTQRNELEAVDQASAQLLVMVRLAAFANKIT